MNNIYKSKWSEATQTWVACSELVRGKTKNNCAKIAAAVALALTSLGSYAADPAPCDNNAGSVVVSGTKCSLPSLPDDKTYTEISASGGAELIGEEGKKIEATGTTKVKKVINVDGGSTLKATNITTTNKVNSKGTNALAIAGSSIVEIDENLTATNMGNKADTIVNSGGSTLTVGKDLTINDDKGFSNGIQNIENSTIGAENITITSKKVGFSNDGILNKDNSVIDVKGEIRITSEGSDGNASIENKDGGKIHAGNITIDQGGKNYAIHQTSETSSIIVDEDLNITSGNIPDGNSTVTIEGGSIEVKGKTDITTHVDSENIEEPENVSAISITNGKYTAKGGADIKIKDDDEKDFTAAAGVIIGNEGIFENSGTLTVNDGANTVIATDIESNEHAKFTNNAGGTTTSHADTIVHNSSGILTVNNDGTLYSDGDSVLKNNKNGDIVVNNNKASSVINGDIINTKNGNITVNNKNSATITGNITNQDSGTVTINNSGKIQNDNTRNKIENSGTGSMDITNTGTIASDILNGNTGDIVINNNKTSSVVNGETDYTNPTTINGDIINNNDGNITVNNNESTSFIKGGITNSQKGSITINNSGSISGSDDTKKITNSNDGEIIINNNHEGSFLSDIENDATSTGLISIKNEGHVVSHISNKNTGIIQIINKDSFGGSIENTGDILINNYNAFGSTINNDGNGTIVINNNENSSPTDRSSIYGVINNNQSGNITVNNNGNESVIDSDINNNAENGNITVNNNTDSAIISGNITNSQAGSININNSGLTVLYRKVTNSGAGKIDIKNKDSGDFQSAIDNDATSTGMITLNNEGTVNSKITNQNTGAIMIINNGTINGSITNTGTKNNVDNIWIDNNKDLKSTIENRDGNIVVNNNKKDSSFTGNIYNNTGYITVNNNEEGTTINSHINNANGGSIYINNKAKTSTIEGDITNINGSVKIENSGEANYSKITNSGGHLNIDNEHEGNFQGDIDNDATGTGIIFIHNYGNTFNGSITNQNTGNIRIINDKIFNSTITNTGDTSTVDKYNIKITNNKELTGSIENNGTGSIYIENTKDTGRIRRIRRITGNITNNNAGTITLDNDGEIASAILNGGAGAINIENNKDSFINGNITNSGAGNISIKNQDKAVLNGNIKNDGSGSITFTNNGDVDASVVNNTSVRINDTSLRQIQNTGNGTITIINNKTLNRPISNASEGTIGITNNGTMKTDITNTKSSTGEIEFINTQEFEGNLINANTGFISALNTKNFTGITDNSDSGKINLDNQGIWNNTGNSVLTKLQNTTGTIIFPKVSEVNAGDKDQYHTITVNGNYTGGGLMRVNTVWNKDGTSYSDRVDIHGDVDGAATTVQTLNGIYGDVTLKEIPIHSAVVVHVAGKSSGNDFTGSAPTTNAGEAQLKKIDTTSGTDYAWTLTAQNKTPEPTNPSVSGPTDPNISEPTDPNVSGPTDPNISEPTAPDKPILPAPPITEVPIYAEPVSGYVQMPTADMELGFTTVGTLHERRGENQTYNITGSNNTALGDDQQQTWGRVLVKHLDKDGKKRLDTAGNQSVLQIGHDFILDENEKTGTRRHIGGYVAYGHNENDFRDQYRAKNGYIVDDHYTGKGRTDAISVGGYGTFYGNNGGYVDLVGQVTYLRNKYNARSNESVHQNGWGAALSAETGKSFIVYGNNWFVEPQAQLVYQYLSLDDFNDRIRHVDQHDPSALRGRVGMRFGYNGDIRDNLPSSSFYGIANIWHDFVNPKSVDIGRDKLKEDYAKTWGEVGLGIQLPITRQSNFYSDIRYEKNFGSDKRKGFKGTMGYKYTWL
ncbi:autotransporter outer membrane beta-barrel domain-containing protein [Snodgrassella sp. W8132]|uniref:autotransporter outer membrane beta-barrel domain-containing protein n=1 Tax=Snodgrassella sp. W8132 TaxID=2750994 RepID=UPI0018DB7045|nr:autotransporter outer membrane beta-barrel domain-containing protein [Snodgrassella sp. W8132]MBI0132541.1 autotransporter outer membrane beta-barrel domain-containing protein [Snodgrassella sp. W8132]